MRTFISVTPPPTITGAEDRITEFRTHGFSNVHILSMVFQMSTYTEQFERRQFEEKNT